MHFAIVLRLENHVYGNEISGGLCYLISLIQACPVTDGAQFLSLSKFPINIQFQFFFKYNI